MHNYTEKELIQQGYEIENGFIDYVDLSMADHGCITLAMGISFNSGYVVYGGYCLGHGYVGAKDFVGSNKGMEYIMRIMDILGCEKFNDIKGKYVRVAIKKRNSSIKIIGNIIKDKWFDPVSFFEEEE